MVSRIPLNRVEARRYCLTVLVGQRDRGLNWVRPRIVSIRQAQTLGLHFTGRVRGRDVRQVKGDVVVQRIVSLDKLVVGTFGPAVFVDRLGWVRLNRNVGYHVGRVSMVEQVQVHLVVDGFTSFNVLVDHGIKGDLEVLVAILL